MFHPPPHKVQATTGPCSFQTVVVMAKVARPHDLIEKETAQSLIRFTQQVLLTQAKHFTFHPHHGTCKAKQVEPSQKFQDILLCGVLYFVICKKKSEHLWNMGANVTRRHRYELMNRESNIRDEIYCIFSLLFCNIAFYICYRINVSFMNYLISSFNNKR